MPRFVNLPTDYARLSKLERVSRRYWAFPQLRRFAYRYRLAKSFVKIEATGFGRSIDTYSAFTKLFLTYTAYEQLIPVASRLKVSGVYPIQTNIVYKNLLAKRIRANAKLQSFIAKSSLESWLKQRLKHMYSGTDDDIVCFAFAIRSLYAHGDLTTTDIGTGLAKERKLIIDTAEAILDYCNEIFSECLNKL